MTAPDPITAAPERPKTISQHIRGAAEATGVPFEFLLAQAGKESGFDPEATNARSSATGLFQFTQGTWLEMVKRHGAKHGLGHLSEQISRGKSGWGVADPETRKEILELRRDPGLSALMAAEYAKDNAKVLRARLGRPVSSHDLTLAHLLGATGAARVLEGKETAPGEPAAHALPAAARANPELFTKSGSGEPHDFAALHDEVSRRYDRAVAAAIPTLRRQEDERELAALRPEPRPEETDPVLPPPPRPLALAQAVEPRHFPVPLPPPAIPGLKGEGEVLRLMLQAMES